MGDLMLCQPEIIRCCVPSVAMQKLLIAQEKAASKINPVELIMGAPVRLEKKCEYLKQLPSAERTTRECAAAI